MNRVIPAVLLIYLFRRVLTLRSREFVRKKSRFRAIYVFPDASCDFRETMFLIGAITIACTWYGARCCIPKSEQFAIHAVIPVATVIPIP